MDKRVYNNQITVDSIDGIVAIVTTTDALVVNLLKKVQSSRWKV